MNVYHMRLRLKSGAYEAKYKLLESELENRYLSDYRKGNGFTFNGRTINPQDIEQIIINTSTEREFQEQVYEVRREEQNSPFVFIGGYPTEWEAADRTKDITDEIILGPPGYEKDKITHEPVVTSKIEQSQSKVFVVHGHDELLKHQVESFLNDVDLKPIILHKQADQGLTILEKFEKHSDVKYAIVLLTPDDLGCSVKNKDQPIEEYELRARQNVVFELGFFIGKLGRGNVCVLYKEGVTPPNDISGLVYKKVQHNVEEVGYELIKELKAAGLNPRL
ncbi:TIR domain-containing protein [Bacillus cereus group sp. IBL03679]|uniref:TIR domain-containing protein n=1 Tax=Bacillus cereus group sp. IBL03679 TaxID=3240095 RepID=UPI003D2F5FA1